MTILHDVLNFIEKNPATTMVTVLTAGSVLKSFAKNHSFVSTTMFALGVTITGGLWYCIDRDENEESGDLSEVSANNLNVVQEERVIDHNP